MSETHEQQIDQSLVPSKPVLPLAEIYQAGQRYVAAHPDQVIPQGKAAYLNNSALFGVPFLIVSQWMSKTLQTQYGPWELIQVYICEVDLAANKISEPALATFHGNVLVNQFKSLTVGDVIGQGVFTIGQKQFKENRNPAYVLKYYEAGKDRSPEELDGAAIPSAFDADADRPVSSGSAVYDQRMADQQTAKAHDRTVDAHRGVLAGNGTGRATGTGDAGTDAASSYPDPAPTVWSLQRELDRRELSWEDVIRISGWTTVRDKNQGQWEQFFTLYDRVFALKDIAAGTNMADAVAKLNEQAEGKQRKSGPRARSS